VPEQNTAAPVVDDTAEVRVTWAELFFDLVFVFAVTEVSTLLRGDQSWLGVAHAIVVFVPIYWVWVGTCVYANTHTIATATDRLGILTIGLVGLFMALAVPDAYHSRGVLFGASYLAARLVLLWLARRGGGQAPITYSVAVLVSGPLLVIGGWALGHVIGGSTGHLNAITFFSEAGTMGTIPVLVVYLFTNLALLLLGPENQAFTNADQTAFVRCADVFTARSLLISSDDVGNAVMLLCLEEANFITGQTLHVDGGGSIMDPVFPLAIQQG